MSSAQSASMGSVPGYTPLAPLSMPAYQAPQAPQTPVPPMPAGYSQNPATQPQRKLLTDQLDPASTSYIGNKYRGALQSATGNLRAGLSGFGGYTVTETASGAADVSRKQGGQPGERYQEALEAERAAANARGMLFSSFADEAVGKAWSRLGEQERDVINAYSAQVSSIMLAQDANFSSVYADLAGLYGQDIQYALENPPPLAPSAPATPAASEPGLAPSALRRTGGGYPSTIEGYGGSAPRGGYPTTLAGYGASPTPPGALWSGTSRPNMDALYSRYGRNIEVRQRGGGLGYVVVRKGS